MYIAPLQDYHSETLSAQAQLGVMKDSVSLYFKLRIIN